MESKNKFIVISVIVVILVVGVIYIFRGNGKPEPGKGPNGEDLPVTASPRTASATGTESFATTTPLQPITARDVEKEETKTEVVVKDAGGELRAYTIEATATKFTPSEIVVDRGDRVQIKVVAVGGTRDITVSEPLGLYFEVKEDKPVVFGFDATIEGRYQFSCSAYCPKGGPESMSGVIIVR
jgi:heme/copper-type cytochrome/quinol oxidase subunit 2